MEDLFVWFARLLFLSVIPLSLWMLSRAWRIGVQRRFEFVRVPRYGRLPNAERWAGPVLAINFLSGAALIGVLVSVVAYQTSFQVWSSAVALIFWIYYFLHQLIGRRAVAEANVDDAQKTRAGS